MSGYRAMVGIGWRGNRRQILGWVLGLAVVFAATAWSLQGLYPTPADLATYARATESGTALRAINGQPFGLTNIGGVIAYEFGFISAIALPLMGIHLTVRMTRAEEQSGRMELLRAGIIGRTAPVAAALTLTVASFVGVAVAMAATLAALGLDPPGAVLYPVTMALLGCGFAAVSAAAAQLVAVARTVTAISLGVLIAVFLARGAGDVAENALVWLSPIGWAEQARPFAAGARWWPVLLLLAFAVVVTAATVAIAERRDLGEGLFASRRGAASAGRDLLHPIGFALRRLRGSVVGWSLISALIAAVFGVLADAASRAMQDNDTLRDVFGGGSADAYLSFVAMLLALVAAGFALQSVGRIAEDEPAGRLEPLLAGAVSRTRWLTAQVLTVAVGTTVVTLIGGLALGISDAAATGDAAAVGRYLLATLAYLPGVLVLLGLAVALYGRAPAWLAAGWLAFAAFAVVAVLAGALQLPGWARQISPLEWVGLVPLEPLNGWAPITSILIAGALGAIGFSGLRRRDIPTRTAHRRLLRSRAVQPSAR